VRARRTKREGFTLIEVMIAVGIITVGSLGILAMQSATIRGNAEARQMSIATQRTRTWMDRLERDALSWNRSGVEPANRFGTRFLQNVTPPTAIPVFAPPDPVDEATGALMRSGASFAGIDVEDAAGPVYCTHIELSWAVQGELIRARVRTTFHRQNGEEFALSTSCTTNADAVSANLASATPDFRAVTATSLLRWRPL
jgi:prepilin-type N-terminal cleavage/methylation domain-containing protein